MRPKDINFISSDRTVGYQSSIKNQYSKTVKGDLSSTLTTVETKLGYKAGWRVAMRGNHAAIVIPEYPGDSTGSSNSSHHNKGRLLYWSKGSDSVLWSDATKEELDGPTLGDVTGAGTVYYIDTPDTGNTGSSGSPGYLDVCENRIVIGFEDAYSSSKSATPGAVWILDKKSDGTWVGTYIFSPDTSPGWVDFGRSVATIGNFVVVAQHNSYGSPSYGGKIYIYKKSESGYTLQQTILRATPDSDGNKGEIGEVVIDSVIDPSSGNTIYRLVVSDPWGTVLGGSGNPKRRIEIYESDSGADFSLKQTITSTDAGHLGISLDISGDYIIAGNLLTSSGAGTRMAKIYYYSNGSWAEQATLTPESGEASNVKFWGVSVGINSKGYAIISDNYVTWPVGSGDGADGYARLYKKSGTSWATIGAFAANVSDSTYDSSAYRPEYGKSIAMNSNSFMVGAPYDHVGNTSGDEHRGVVYTYESVDTTTFVQPTFRFMHKGASNLRGQSTADGKFYKTFVG